MYYYHSRDALLRRETLYVCVLEKFHIQSSRGRKHREGSLKCGKAYVTLYEGKGTNVAVKESFCGLSALPSHIEWEGEYVTLFFYVDYRTPAPSDPTDPSKFLYPEVFFRLDVTSFDFGKSFFFKNRSVQ